MAYKINTVIRNGREHAISAEEIGTRDRLIRNARTKLTRFDRHLNPEDLAKVMQALNAVTDLLSGRQPKDDVENEEGCDCVENGRVCQCVDDEDDKPEPDTKANAALVRNWDLHRGQAGVERELERKSYHQNSAHERELRLIRNSVGSAFLDDKDLAEIAARNSRSRKR